MKLFSKPMKKVRSKPRFGRLKGTALEALREACYNRDHGICQECGGQCHDGFTDTHPHKYHMAHITAKRIGLDTLENVRTECGQCHRAFHNFGPSRTKPVPRKETA